MKNEKCICTEKGRDGTVTHKGDSGVTIGGIGNMLVYPCRNHLYNYTKFGSIFPVVKANYGEHKVNKQTSDRKDVLKAALKVADGMNEMVTAFERYHPSEHAHKRSNEGRKLRGALKQIANYGKDVALHTWVVGSFRDAYKKYNVRQLLIGGFDCSCESFVYKTGLDSFGQCKHIRNVKWDAANRDDINYGIGAQEAHRRLTKLAKVALGEDSVAPVTPNEQKYKIMQKLNYGLVKSCTFPNTYSHKEALKLVNNSNLGANEYKIVEA